MLYWYALYFLLPPMMENSFLLTGLSFTLLMVGCSSQQAAQPSEDQHLSSSQDNQFQTELQGTKSYCDKRLGFCFEYPSAWQVGSVYWVDPDGSIATINMYYPKAKPGYIKVWITVYTYTEDTYSSLLKQQFERSAVVIVGDKILLIRTNGGTDLFQQFERTLKTLSAVRSSSQNSKSVSENKIYLNTQDGYSIEYPSNWTVQERTSLPSWSQSSIENGSGTLLTPINPFQPQANIFIQISSISPDLSHYFDLSSQSSTGRSIMINGRKFSVASASDGAAGSVGEVTYYASKIDATHSIVLIVSHIHTTGDAYDEPKRSEILGQIADQKKVLDRIVQSFKVQ